jgi:hypothetical protein
LDKIDQLTAVLEALLYTESGGGAPLKDIDQVNHWNFGFLKVRLAG